MTCKNLIEFLVDYLEKTLREGQQKEFDRHLRDCPDCEAYLSSYVATIKIAGKTMRDAPLGGGREDLPEELIRAILAARKKQGR